MSEKDRIAVTMDSGLKQAIRVEAAKRGVPMSELAEEVLREEFKPGNLNPMSVMA